MSLIEGTSYLDLTKLALVPLDTKLLCLLKVGAREHIEKLANGEIYCRHMNFYKDQIFKDHPFYDQYEGLAQVLQSDLIKVNIGTPDNQIELSKENGLVGSVVVSANLPNPTFCLHAIHTGDWTHRQFTESEIEVFKAYLQIPNEMFKFKDTIWIITDWKKFCERLEDAINKANIGIRHGFVKYVDLTKVHGKVPNNMLGFIKQMKHSDEREYRLMFFSKDKAPDPFQLSLGSLRDISMVMPLKEFTEKWELGFE